MHWEIRRHFPSILIIEHMYYFYKGGGCVGRGEIYHQEDEEEIV